MSSSKWQSPILLRSGGQGKVYKVKDSNGSFFAKKVVTVQGFQKKKLERIKQEIDIIKTLKDSPNIIRIYEDNISSLKEDGKQEVYYVMDFARHGSLKDNDFYIGDIETSLQLFKEMLRGVASAHKRGVIHRDLKPDNILFFPDQKSISISDFGIGLLKAQPINLTEDDEILGPANFIAPEQYKNPSKADARSDIYSLGKILFYMLTGKTKIFRESIGNLNDYFAEPNPHLSLIQDRLLAKMIVASPEKRFQECDEIIDELDSLLSQIKQKSLRTPKRGTQKFSIYDYLVTDKKLDEFIEDFSSDLGRNIYILELLSDELMRSKKIKIFDRIKRRLLEKYATGKAQDAINATFAFIESPSSLSAMQAKSRYSFAAFYLSKYFLNAESYEFAHQYVLMAIDKETSQALASDYLEVYADICKGCACSREHDFLPRMLELLSQSSEDSKRAKILKTIGNHYLELSEKEKGLRYLESYLIFKPNDTGIRFNVAYEYSQLDKQALAFYHYNLHLKTAKEPDGTVFNNLGALFESNGIQMQIRAMEMYEKAAKEGSGRAVSNLAYMYLRIGLKQKAHDILSSFIAEHADEEYDEKVDEAIGDIHKELRTEKDKEVQLKDAGSIFNRYNTRSILVTPSLEASWIGGWELEGGICIEIKSKDSEFIVTTLMPEGGKLEIEFDGHMGKIQKYSPSTYGSSYDDGFLYLESADAFVGYVVGSKWRDIKEISGKRISDIKAHVAAKRANNNLGYLQTLLKRGES